MKNSEMWHRVFWNKINKGSDKPTSIPFGTTNTGARDFYMKQYVSSRLYGTTSQKTASLEDYKL